MQDETRIHAPGRITVLYDADCGLCRSVLAALLAWDRRRRLRPLALDSGEARALTPGMDEEERAASLHAVLPGGAVRSGGYALPELLAPLPGGRPLAAALRAAPGLSRRGYEAVAGRRGALGRLVPGALTRRAERAIRARSGPREGPQR